MASRNIESTLTSKDNEPTVTSKDNALPNTSKVNESPKTSTDFESPLKPSFDCDDGDEKTLSLTTQIICDILQQNRTIANETKPDEQETVESQSDTSSESRDFFDPNGRPWMGRICHPTSPVNDRKCRLLRQISENILTGTPIEAEFRDETTNDVLTYLDGTPDDIRTSVANYLSSGRTDEILITMDNLHYFFHVSRSLCLQQLEMHCFSFCSTNSQPEILACFKSCQSCREVVEKESETGYERSLSILSNPDETSLPEFYIAFSAESSNKGTKSMAIVVDISQKKDIFQCKLSKSQKFDKGFRCCSCDVKHSPYIFVTGGSGKNSNLMWRYDVIMDSWQKAPKMHHGRSKHAMVSVRDERIFILGGQEVPCIEEYNIKEKTWTEKGALQVHVYSAVGISHGNSIFVFGGCTSAGPVSTVQRYNLETNRVTTLDNLPVAFKCGQAVVMGDFIYIATGQGHMICFDPETGHSHLCAQQPVLRKHFGMFVKDERIYLVGGTLTEGSPDEGGDAPQYRYNLDKDQWVKKYNLCKCFPIYSSCIIKYPQKCSIVPFHGM